MNLHAKGNMHSMLTMHLSDMQCDASLWLGEEKLWFQEKLWCTAMDADATP